MAANTGRTVSKFVNLVLGDNGNVIRDIPINSLSVVGVAYETQSVHAFQDAVMGELPNFADAPIDITGPFSSKAATAASGTGAVPTYSGSHTILSVLNGLMVPRTLDVQVGIRQTWEAGEPQFGISQSGSSGYLVVSYLPNLDDMTYSAQLRLFPGSLLPAWGTAAEA
jgi:hypothetical protein